MTNSLNYTPDRSTTHSSFLSRLKKQGGRIAVFLFASYALNCAYHIVMLGRDYDRWYAPQKQEVDRLHDWRMQRYRLNEVLDKSSHIEGFDALVSTRGSTQGNSLELNDYHSELKRCGFYASLEVFRHETRDRMNNLDDQIKHLEASTKYDTGRKMVEHHTVSAIVPFYYIIYKR